MPERNEDLPLDHSVAKFLAVCKFKEKLVVQFQEKYEDAEESEELRNAPK